MTTPQPNYVLIERCKTLKFWLKMTLTLIRMGVGLGFLVSALLLTFCGEWWHALEWLIFGIGVIFAD